MTEEQLCILLEKLKTHHHLLTKQLRQLEKRNLEIESIHPNLPLLRNQQQQTNADEDTTIAERIQRIHLENHQNLPKKVAQRVLHHHQVVAVVVAPLLHHPKKI